MSIKQTSQTDITMKIVDLLSDGGLLFLTTTINLSIFNFRADEGDSVVLTKYVAMLDGRDTPADELLLSPCSKDRQGYFASWL